MLLGENGLLTTWMVFRIRKIDYQINFLLYPILMRPRSWCLCSCKSVVLALFIDVKSSSLASCLADMFLAPRGGLPFAAPDSGKATQGVFSECLA